MKVKVYAKIVVDEVEVSKAEYNEIASSHTNAIPDQVFDQVEGSLHGKAELCGIDMIANMNDECIQRY